MDTLREFLAAGCVHSILRANERTSPAGVALVANGRSVGWAELRAEVEDVRASLVAAGVVRGSIVALLEGRAEREVALYFAIASIGAVAAPLDPALSATELRRICADCRPTFACSQPETAARLREVISAAGLRTKVLEDIAAGPAGEPAVASGKRTAPASWDDVHLIVYAEGRAAEPRGVMISHRQAVLNAAAASAGLGIRRQDRVLLAYSAADPFRFQWLVTLWIQQATVALAPVRAGTFDLGPDDLPDLSVIVADPVALEAALASGARLSNAQRVILSCADSAVQQRGAAVAAAGRFGLAGVSTALLVAETGPVLLVAREVERNAHPNMLGTALPGCDIALIDDGGREAGPGGVGRIHVRSPMVAAGYCGSAEVGVAATGLHGVRTGILAWRTGEGILHPAPAAAD
ncbi:MAG: acyl--CoA ligase [Rhizobiaceae bacterium]|nr:acyl--CoA ligase [Rhizobiaceae bacterium]